MKRHTVFKTCTAALTGIMLFAASAACFLPSRAAAGEMEVNSAEDLEADEPEDEFEEDDPEDEEDLDSEDDFMEEYANEVYFEKADYGYDHRIESFLIIGTDGSGNEDEIGEEYRGAMADFLTLFVIDHTDDSYGFLELDRNTITPVCVTNSLGDRLGYYDIQLCYSHYYGSDPESSAENTLEAVGTLLGDLETIDGYYALNMDDVGILADAVDGVEVTLEDDLTSIDPSFVPGAAVVLKGDQAEAYLRARMEVGDGDNKGRMRRQRAFINAFYDKAIEKIKSDKTFLNDLYAVMKDAAVTDISGNEVSRIAEAMRRGTNKGIVGIEGETRIEVSQADGEEHEAFYPKEESVIDAMTKLYSLHLLYSYEDDEDAA